MTVSLSVIIPALNEEKHLPDTLAVVCAADISEVIVVDGGSNDQTVMLARTAGCTVLTCPPGRARQLNHGAAAASGELLLFVHADTLLPRNFPSRVRQTMAQPDVALGAFSLAIDSVRPGLTLIARVANIRSRFCNLPYGDQALFTSRTLFTAIGGFPAMEIMEDFVFVRRMQQLGRVVLLPEKVITSARRWQNIGPIRTTLINQLIVCGYSLGVPPAKLARWYQRLRGLTCKQ